ncbi:DNA-binding protein [Kitasatospora cineracea]|uniref:Excisionase family DNA binding protein n=1 Tax=Kitasatospora cineracea TaxID=88074 RepID=A0A3N4R273_9ACTN|nr:DNA-binding protein [Kitasatospora cineracea]RPE27302.1 hypothetical protein EDD38_7447 [Kitasatospora cineracea]
MPAPVLITTADASLWTGHPQGTIRRWAHEGRITRHPHHPRGVRLDLNELPPAVNGTPGAVPPLPTRTAAAA